MTDFPTLLCTSTCEIPILLYTWRVEPPRIGHYREYLPPPEGLTLHPFHLTSKKSTGGYNFFPFFVHVCYPKENHIRVLSKSNHQRLVYNYYTYWLLNLLVSLSKPVWIQSRIVLRFLVPWHPVLQKEVQHGKIVLSPCFLIKASTITCLVPVSNYFCNPSSGKPFSLHQFATAVESNFSASDTLCFLFPVNAVYVRPVLGACMAWTKADKSTFGNWPILKQVAILFKTWLWSSLSCCGSPVSSTSGTYKSSLKFTPWAV